MALFWKRGAMTADAVREALPNPLRESTVRTLLRRITEKGYLSRDVDGRTYVFRAMDVSRFSGNVTLGMGVQCTTRWREASAAHGCRYCARRAARAALRL